MQAKKQIWLIQKAKGSTILWVVALMLLLKAGFMSMVHPVMLWHGQMADVVEIEAQPLSELQSEALHTSELFADYRRARNDLLMLVDNKSVIEVSLSQDLLIESYALAAQYSQHYKQGELHFHDWFLRHIGASGYNEQEVTEEAAYQQQLGMFNGMQVDRDIHAINTIRSVSYIILSLLLTGGVVLVTVAMVVIMFRPYIKGRWGQVSRQVLSTLPVSLGLAMIIPYLMHHDLSTYRALEVVSPYPNVFWLVLFNSLVVMTLGRLMTASNERLVAKRN